MTRTIVIYALVLVAATFALQWLEYRYAMRHLPASLLLGVLGAGFICLGIWVGLSLARRAPQAEFELNERGLESLGISSREYAVLELLAGGMTNKEIARALDISPNTVKSHVARLYEKLGVSRRTEAVNRSRELRLIP